MYGVSFCSKNVCGIYFFRSKTILGVKRNYLSQYVIARIFHWLKDKRNRIQSTVHILFTSQCTYCPAWLDMLGEDYFTQGPWARPSI